MKEYRTLFWDLDGTLTDSREGIFNALGKVEERFSLNLTYEERLSCIGPPLRKSFARLLPDVSKVDEAVRVFREYYLPIGAYENKLFDGIYDALLRIRNEGYTMYVATSKKWDSAIGILKKFGIFDFFDRVFGADDTNGICEKEEVLEYALKRIDIDKSECLMIGDTMYDVRGAEYVGIDSFACLYGFGTNEELLASSIVGSVETPEQLVDVFCKKH